MFADKQDAWMTGFKDGFLNITDRLVENFHAQYEVGFISGASERREVEREQLSNSKGMDYYERGPLGR